MGGQSRSPLRRSAVRPANQLAELDTTGACGAVYGTSGGPVAGIPGSCDCAAGGGYTPCSYDSAGGPFDSAAGGPFDSTGGVPWPYDSTAGGPYDSASAPYGSSDGEFPGKYTLSSQLIGPPSRYILSPLN
eukprot:436645-Prorocentrum_minimum.AAC.1